MRRHLTMTGILFSKKNCLLWDGHIVTFEYPVNMAWVGARVDTSGTEIWHSQRRPLCISGRMSETMESLVTGMSCSCRRVVKQECDALRQTSCRWKCVFLFLRSGGKDFDPLEGGLSNIAKQVFMVAPKAVTQHTQISSCKAWYSINYRLYLPPTWECWSAYIC